MRVHLDHLVLAGPDLTALVAEFAERTGVTPAAGGRHPGRGTANHLVGLGHGSYLELIGPDPDQPEPEQPRPFGIDDLTEPRLVTWAVRPDDLDATIATARRDGYDPGDAAAMSRRTPDGDELAWRLTPARGVVPFLIDWGTSTHPTSSALPRLTLEALTIEHPDPAALRRQLEALAVSATVSRADETRLTARLGTPRGELTV